LRAACLIPLCCVAIGHLQSPTWAGEANAPIVIHGSRTLLPLVETWSNAFGQMPEAIPALDRISLIRLVSGDSDEDSTYALSRPLFFYTTDDLPWVFVAFCLS